MFGSVTLLIILMRIFLVLVLIDIPHLFHHTTHTHTLLSLSLPPLIQLHCTPGQTVQQVIESEMPEISHSGYQVYQFPSRALLNPEKEASVLQDQEISIEPMRHSSPGK